MGKRKQKKFEKELRDRRAAEAKVNADEAKKKAEEERRANMTDEEKKEEGRTTAIGCAVLFVIVIAMYAMIRACGSDDEETTDSTESAESTIEEDWAEDTTVKDSPLMSGQVVSFAESKDNITIDPIDIGQHIVDGVDVQRGVLDRTNWRIAAYCPKMVGNTVIAGVIKEEEFRVITAAAQGTPIAENSLTYLLDCPGE